MCACECSGRFFPTPQRGDGGGEVSVVVVLMALAVYAAFIQFFRRGLGLGARL